MLKYYILLHAEYIGMSIFITDDPFRKKINVTLVMIFLSAYFV